MKFENKKTGQIGELVGGTGLMIIIRVYGGDYGGIPFVDYQYDSLYKLNREWRDSKDV